MGAILESGLPKCPSGPGRMQEAEQPFRAKLLRCFSGALLSGPLFVILPKGYSMVVTDLSPLSTLGSVLYLVVNKGL